MSASIINFLFATGFSTIAIVTLYFLSSANIKANFLKQIFDLFLHGCWHDWEKWKQLNTIPVYYPQQPHLIKHRKSFYIRHCKKCGRAESGAITV